MNFQLKGDTGLNSPTYILTSDFQYPLPNFGHSKCDEESVETFRVSNNHQYLSMICIHSDSKPYKVQMTLNDMIFAECTENSIVLANLPNDVFSEFVNDSRFHPDKFPKRHEPHGENCYKILLYRDTPNLHHRPKGVSTTSYFFPVNHVKYNEIKVRAFFRENLLNVGKTSCELIYADHLPIYDIYTEINGKKTVMRVSHGAAGFPEPIEYYKNHDFSQEPGIPKLVDRIVFNCN